MDGPAPVPRLHVLGVALFAALFAGAAAVVALDGPIQVFASTALAAATGAIAYEDARALRVPDAWILFALIAGLAARGATASGSSLAAEIGVALLEAAACGGAFLLLRETYWRLRKMDGLGMGDVKLAAIGGLWLGWLGLAASVALAAAAALLLVAGHALRGRWPADRRLPFAAFLAPAIWLWWFKAALVASP
jgi:leader peptidase (prepilin peptidase)/N-methyltransferase